MPSSGCAGRSRRSGGYPGSGVLGRWSAPARCVGLGRGDQESGGPESRSVKEACGVFGGYAPGRAVAHLTFDGIYALQHRGQESAGMAVGDGETITVMRDMGLVTTVFDERTLAGVPG